MSDSPRYRVGIDIGGTFTDAVVLDESTGDFRPVKVSSTPDDPSIGFMNALIRTFESLAVEPQQVSFAVHGTTVATNTIIQHKGARVGLIASRGFRDILEIAWQIRPDIYDVFYDKPVPLVARHLCEGVPERVDADGSVLVPLDEEAVRRCGRRFKRHKVEVVVICFLHSYRNPTHERRAARILREEFQLPVCASSDICPEYREYARASTAAVNAALLPEVGSYVERLEGRLQAAQVGSGLFLMTSGGGIIASDTARENPVQLVESGPAAGVIAAAFVAEMTGFKDLIALDIGGTTAKAALIEDSRPRLASEFEVGQAAVATTTRNKGRGYPVKTPVIDLVEIGAGGGSIGHVDPGGALAVGPQSAGADPGPACYGKGGMEPTLTDANLALGRLNPEYFLGGELRLERGLAEEALRRRIGGPLKMSVAEAANGMIEIANAGMIGALQLVSVQKGIDPRGFVLVAFGGSGPLFAAALAGALHIRTVLVPPSPGVTSALGLLATDLRHDYVRTYITPTAELDIGVLKAVYGEVEKKATNLLLQEGVACSHIRFVREVDIRYRGQSSELRVPLRNASLDEDLVSELNEDFFAAHRRSYGFAVDTEPTEIVNIRLSTLGSVPRPKRREIPRGKASPEAALKEQRPVWLTPHERPEMTNIYDRYLLKSGNRFSGPAIVEEIDSTTLILGGCAVEVDGYGNLLIEIGESGSLN